LVQHFAEAAKKFVISDKKRNQTLADRGAGPAARLPELEPDNLKIGELRA
jgi:hypothetical protein